jgi:hypothetical protein
MNEMSQINKPASLMSKLNVNLLIGLVGMLIVIGGTLISPGTTQKVLYLIGAVFMLVSAALERQLFFVILQVVIVVGAAVAFTHWPILVKAMVPLAFSIAALIYFYFTEALHDRLTQVGCGGLIAIALGFANSSPIIYLIGGVLLAIYGFWSFRRGVKIAMLWAILNSIFALTSLVAIYHWVKV